MLRETGHQVYRKLLNQTCIVLISQDHVIAYGNWQYVEVRNGNIQLQVNIWNQFCEFLEHYALILVLSLCKKKKSTLSLQIYITERYVPSSSIWSCSFTPYNE